MNLPRLAVTRPVTTTMVFIALALLGLFSMNRLAIDLIPEISFPSLTISTSYSGAAPEEMESLVTIPIEQAVATLNGVTGMQSTSREGSSRVTLNFRWGTDLDAVTNEVRASVDQVRSRLPSEASAPRVFRFDPNQSPIMTIGLGGALDPADLRRIAQDEFIYHLERLDGVASVTLQGGRTREVRVVLDPVRLQGHRLTIDQVVQAIRAENLNVPAGRIHIGQAQFSLRTLGELEGTEALANILVASRAGVHTRLGDIAVIDAATEDDGTRVRVDGQPGAVLSVQKQSGANTVRVADAVLRTLDELQQRHPEISARPLNDTSVFIRRAVNNVITAGLYGGVLAALILLVFLRSLRATLIIAVVIPVAIVTSFILIERFGMTLNIMSLGGLALGIGMLLDNSIIVLENVYRHRALGKEPNEAAIDGAAEMGSAIIASTMTTLAVFLPMLFITGTSGILFRQLSMMVGFSVLCSLFVALTLLPVMCSRILQAAENGKPGVLGAVNRWLERAVVNQEEMYSRSVLQRFVRRPALVLFVATAFFAGSLALVPYLGTELLAQTDEGDIGIFISMPPGTQVDATDAMVLRIEEIVRSEVPELMAMDSRIGSGSGSVNVTLVSSSERSRSTQEVATDLREIIAEIPGITSRVSVRSNFAQRLSSGSFGGGGGERISLGVQGQDLELIRSVADELQYVIGEVPGVTNVSVSRDEAQPEFVVRVDRDRAADLGLSTTQVANAVQTAVQGRVATQLRVNGREQSVRVVLQGMAEASTADIETLPIPIGGGEYIPLVSVGTLLQQDTPVGIDRIDQQRTVVLRASPEGRDLGSVVADLRAAVLQHQLPEGVTVYFGGEYEEQQRAFREMLTVLLLALALVYIVMASQFESLFDPLIVMFSVPFAVVGVVLILFLTGTPLTTQAFMGLIMLGGIVVNNAIVLVTYINLLREQGHGLDEAIVEGCRSRLRPIVMTAGSTILGLVPLALEFGEGSEVQAPLARAVIGGLLVSTLVTLVLIPTLYRWAHRWRARRRENVATPGTGAPMTTHLSALVVCVFAGLALSGAVHAQTPDKSSTTLTPEAVASQAVEHNPRIANARRSLAVAESELREAQAAYRPRLDIGADWSKDEPLPGSIGSPRQSTSVSLSVRETFLTGPSFGRANIALERAERDVHMARLELQHEVEALTLDVLSAYVNVLKAERALQVSEQAVQRAEETLREITMRVDLGMAGEYDLVQAEAQHASAISAVRSAQRRQEIARVRLNHLTRNEVPHTFELADLSWSEETRSEAEQLLVDHLRLYDSGHFQGRAPEDTAVWERVFDRRLDVIRAQNQLVDAQNVADSRLSGRSPTVSVGGSLNYPDAEATLSWNSRDRNTALTVEGDVYQSGQASPSGGGSAGNRPNWSVGVSVSWPLWDGGIEKETALQEGLRIEQLQESLAEQQRSVAIEVVDAHYALLDAVERVRIAALDIDVASERLRQTKARVQGGVETPNAAFDAEIALLQAERALSEATWDAALAHARFRRAAGLEVWPVSPSG